MTEQPPQPPSGPPPPPPGGGYPPPPQPGGFPPPGGAPGPGFGGQPVGQLPPEAYTSWIHRVAAYIIDSIPIAIVMGIAYGIAIATGENTCVTDAYGYGAYCTSSMSAIGVILLGLGYIATLAYAIWNWGFKQGTTGSSIGKGVMKFKVVSEETGQPIGFGMSIVRQLAHVVDSIVCYVGWFFPLWDAKRQTLADKIMKTVCLPL